MPNRREHLARFYDLLGQLAQRNKGSMLLAACNGRMNWPKRGVYFFHEPGEVRTDTGTGPRIVRVGTHALTAKSKSTLWKRLSQHKGTSNSGGGNHRGSIFRLLVGTTLLDNALDSTTWGVGSTAPAEVRATEAFLEVKVSTIIRSMPFLCLDIDDEPSRQSLRGYIERNSIALLSNFNKPLLDSPSATWRGHLCNRDRVRRSGLWNQNHVDEVYDPMFLDTLEALLNNLKANA